MKTLYIDCAMGCAGDMLTAALLELHPDREGFIRRMNAVLNGKAVVSAVADKKCGIVGTHVSVLINGEEEGEHEHHHHDDDCDCGCHDHDHEHHHHDDDCDCGCHDHDHDHHHHDHDDDCGCHDHDHEHHHHDHDDECGCGCHDHHHDHEGHHHADDVFTSWGLENVGVMKREDLQKILDDLAYGDKYGEVLRAKGMVPSEEKGVWLHFDMVPEQAEIREGAPDFTGKVCVIGAELDEEGLKAAFNA